MTQQEREEIERALALLETAIFIPDNELGDAARRLFEFARQQLNLRVDGQKFMERFIDSNLIAPSCVEDDSHGIVVVWSSCAPEQLEALVLECITTTPEEKE